jgi:hypothetical protein
MVDTHVSPKRTRKQIARQAEAADKKRQLFLPPHKLQRKPERIHTANTNYDEPVLKASELDSIWLAPTKEVALAQINAMRGFSSPNWATPRTVEEQIGYRRSFRKFANFASDIANMSVRRPGFRFMSALSYGVFFGNFFKEIKEKNCFFSFRSLDKTIKRLIFMVSKVRSPRALTGNNHSSPSKIIQSR